MEPKTVATNKKAFRDFAILESWDCGIELKGSEVKSVRAGKVNFKDSFARLEKDEVMLYNLHIGQYEAASYLNVDSDRARKLLLHKKEIKKIFGLTTQRGFALVPLRVYFNRRGFAKVALGLGRGKKLYDKRETLKQKTAKREMDRALRARHKGR